MDFPLNDGGLFYVMVRDIQRAHYHLPAFTSYNDAHIPFGYSPLAFYLAAVLNDSGFDLFTLFRVLPFIASTLSIVAFYLLARQMVQSRAAIAVAVIAFAIVPRGFVWLLMGGGLTRSFGYLFALLSLHQVWMLYTRRSLPIRAARDRLLRAHGAQPSRERRPSSRSARYSFCSFTDGIARA